MNLRQTNKLVEFKRAMVHNGTAKNMETGKVVNIDRIFIVDIVENTMRDRTYIDKWELLKLDGAGVNMNTKQSSNFYVSMHDMQAEGILKCTGIII